MFAELLLCFASLFFFRAARISKTVIYYTALCSILIFKVQFHACPILDEGIRYALWERRKTKQTAVQWMAKNIVDFFFLFPTKKSYAYVVRTQRSQRDREAKRAYFQSERKKCRLTFVDIWCSVSFEMNLSEWLKALMRCHSTFAVYLGRFLKSVYGCCFFSVFAEPLYKTIPENFSFLSLDNCTEWASSQFLFVQWLVCFFPSLRSLFWCVFCFYLAALWHVFEQFI